MTDDKSGISIRFVKQWDISADQQPQRMYVSMDENTAAEWLIAQDRRDVPYAEKRRDALARLRALPITVDE